MTKSLALTPEENAKRIANRASDIDPKAKCDECKSCSKLGELVRGHAYIFPWENKEHIEKYCDNGNGFPDCPHYPKF